jgi:Apea-like HEPN
MSGPTLPETTHPYAVRVSLKLGSNVELNLGDDDVRLPFGGDFLLRIQKEHTSPDEQANFIKHISVDLEAFPSAGEAERAGRLLTLSLLWIAASKRVTVGFGKWTGQYPFAIRDRTRSDGITCHARGRVFYPLEPAEVSSIAEEAFRTGRDVAPSVLTSLEFYASARMESTPHAQFIGLMTALEALSDQRDYGDDVAGLLDGLAKQLESSPLLAGQDKSSLRNSLSGRLKQLRQESVRQAILRTVSEHIADGETIRFLDEAYGIRSKILHEGFRAADLPTLARRCEDVLRQVYSAILGLTLRQE